MTDAAVATPTEATEAEAPESEGPTFKDPMQELAFKQLAGLIGERNSKVGRINAVKGDRLSLLKELEEKSDNPEAVKARAARDKAQEELDEAVMALHKAVQPEIESLTQDAEKSVESIENEVKEADQTIKPGMTYFKKVYGEDLAKHLPGLERLKGFSSRGTGGGGRRIRGYVVTVEVDGESRDFDNVATAAKYLDVETGDLQGKFFEAAGNPEKLADAPDTVSFEVSYEDTYEDGTKEQKVASVTATRTAKDEGPAEDDESDESVED